MDQNNSASSAVTTKQEIAKQLVIYATCQCMIHISQMADSVNNQRTPLQQVFNSKTQNNLSNHYTSSP